jgi:hypothetical protein
MGLLRKAMHRPARQKRDRQKECPAHKTSSFYVFFTLIQRGGGSKQRIRSAAGSESGSPRCLNFDPIDNFARFPLPSGCHMGGY